MEWYWIAAIAAGAIAIIVALSAAFYRQFFKRFYDIVLSGMAILVLSPLLLILTVVGAIAMRGNPFFVQARPGWHEKVFYLIKFRTMDNRKDADGNLLPDEVRLNRYGRILRKTSLDELPELFNIFIGQMSIVGPRPLLVQYLPLYNEEQHHRHDVRPGLTGLAQINGRFNILWQDKFRYDVQYVNQISLMEDIRIIFVTALQVFREDDIESKQMGSWYPFLGNDVEDQQIAMEKNDEQKVH